MRNNSGIHLRIHKDISEHNAHRPVVVSKIRCSRPPEILREAFSQYSVVFRRQAKRKVVRFDIKGKRILETQEKYYLSDLGLRHAVIGYRDNDIAGVLENTVFLELLRRGFSVNIGKQDVAEVDFVANRADDRLYIQVCYILTPENTDREFAPLEAISDNYEKLVLSTDTLLRVNRGGIRQKNIIDFLLEH